MLLKMLNLSNFLVQNTIDSVNLFGEVYLFLNMDFYLLFDVVIGF